MFKVTLSFLLFGVFAVIAQPGDQCCPDIRKSLADLKSDYDALIGLIVALSANLEQEFNWTRVICHPGFTYLSSTKNCYKAVFESHNWTSAVKTCQTYRPGSHLVAISSEVESNELKTFLASELTKNPGNNPCVATEWTGLGSFFWTSGQRQILDDCKSPFVWKPSSDQQLPFVFKDWLIGEPNCGSVLENCMHLWATKQFQWNDARCTIKICPVCQYTP